MSLNKNNIFCISLFYNIDGRTLNIRDKFKNQAESFGMEFTFFDAIDGKKIKMMNCDDSDVLNDKQTMCETACGIRFNYTPSKHIRPSSNPTLSKYYIGCALSHLCLYKKLLYDNKNDYYLIFEDDFIFSKTYNFNDLKKDVINLPPKFDLCFFSPKHVSCRPYPKENTINDYIYKYSGAISGTSMYMISKQCAKKILDYDGLNVNFAADELLTNISINSLIPNMTLDGYSTNKMYGFGHLERHNFKSDIVKRLNLNY